MNEKFTPRFSDFRALNDLGSKFKDLGKFDRAIYCFKNAIKMSGDERAIFTILILLFQVRPISKLNMPLQKQLILMKSTLYRIWICPCLSYC